MIHNDTSFVKTDNSFGIFPDSWLYPSPLHYKLEYQIKKDNYIYKFLRWTKHDNWGIMLPVKKLFPRFLEE